MIKLPKKSQFGFTLIELMIVITIFSFIITILASIMIVFLKIKYRNEARQQVKTEGGLIMERLEYYIRNSIKLVDGSESYGSGSNVIEGIDCASIDGGESNPLTLGLEYVDYSVSLAAKKYYLAQIFADSNSPQKLKIKTYTDLADVSKNKEIQLNSDDVTLLGFKLECNDNYLDLEAIEKYRYVQIDFTLTKSKKTLGADDNDPVVVKFSRLVMMRNPF